MEFQYPLLLLLLPLFLISYIPVSIWKEKKNNKNLKLFIGNNSKNLLPTINNKIKIIKYILLFSSIILLIISLARPQKGFIWQEATTSGIDIVIAIDTSKSMEAIDVTPNRLTRAKMALLELSSQLNGDRIALIPFAGSSFVMTPFTADYNIFNQSVSSINTQIIPKGGTNIKSAISSSEELFKDKNSHKILILVTDGEDLANKGIEEAKRVADLGVQIFTVGVGTKDGELIPDPSKKGQYLRDKKGNVVKSRLDENSLIQIAKSTNGDYRHISSSGNGILEIYQEKLYELEQLDKSEQRSRIPIDFYRWFLLPAIILLLLEFLIVNIKTKKINKKTILTSLLLLNMTGLFSTPADDAFKKGDIDKAISLYQKEKKTPETLYNLGTAYYIKNDFVSAVTQYQDGLEKANADLQSRILFNLGNSLYRVSEQTEEMSEKIDLLKASLESYKGSLALKNRDKKVQKNHDFIKNILDQIEQNQDEQKQTDESITEEMTKEEAEALLKALEGEEVDLKYILNSDDNTYSGEW
ncbi:MAG: VWA domain-containing protein [Spirochaetaceae bacterium]